MTYDRSLTYASHLLFITTTQGGCLSYFSVIVIEYPDKSYVRDKGLICLTVPEAYNPSWQERHDSRWGRHEGRSRELPGHVVASFQKQRNQEGL